MNKIPDINLNQNLWALVFSSAALGLGEYFQLEKLECAGFIFMVITGLSYLITLTAYTTNYW
jgi:hypothetical protein